MQSSTASSQRKHCCRPSRRRRRRRSISVLMRRCRHALAPTSRPRTPNIGCTAEAEPDTSPSVVYALRDSVRCITTHGSSTVPHGIEYRVCVYIYVHTPHIPQPCPTIKDEYDHPFFSPRERNRCFVFIFCRRFIARSFFPSRNSRPRSYHSTCAVTRQANTRTHAVPPAPA